MLIFRYRRPTCITALAASALLLMRCAPSEHCLRVSDCYGGLTCIEGTCRAVSADTSGDGGASSTRGASGNSASTAPSTADASTAVAAAPDSGAPNASKPDAAAPDASSPTGGGDASTGSTDTSTDF